MKPSFKRNCFSVICVLALALTTVYAEGLHRPLRLDIFDAANNALMFITFEYDGFGVHRSRTVYMSDSTFMRRVAVNYDNNGQRSNDISYNFNDDTSYITTYQHSAGALGFSITDQFRVDQVGGMVTATTADQLNYGVYYKTNDVAASISYEKDEHGNPVRVTVTGQNGEVYYGIFTNGDISGVQRPRISAGATELRTVSVHPRGVLGVDIRFNLRKASQVRCDLMTLSGRRAGTPINGAFKAGTYERTLRSGDATMNRVAAGVYMLVVSVDGAVAYSGKYLHQSNAKVGGVK